MCARRRAPYRGARPQERFRQHRVIRHGHEVHGDLRYSIAAGYQEKIENHIIGRNQSVAEVLSYCSLLRNAGIVADSSAVASRGAAWQSASGHRRHETVAAHCLPCQLKIANRLPSEHMPNRASADAIRGLFAKTTVLPSAFNTADKAAERTWDSIEDAFIAACQAVISARRVSDDPQTKLIRHIGERYGEIENVECWPIDRKTVRSAYDQWAQGALAAYRQAEFRVRTEGFQCSSSEDPGQIADILLAYARAGQEIPTGLSDKSMDEIENRFNGIELKWKAD